METGDSFITPWMEMREAWVKSIDGDGLLRVIEQVAELGELDENGGDLRETRETIVWLASRGQRGREWGISAQPAKDLGLANF